MLRRVSTKAKCVRALAQTGSWNAPETMVEEHSSGTAYTNQPQARCEWVADTDTHVVDFANY